MRVMGALRCLYRRRYGSPIAVLNLVKLAERHPRESLLGRELAAAVAHLNRQVRALFPCSPLACKGAGVS